MLNGGREGLFEQGRRFQQEGDSRAALQCFLSCLLGLTHVQSFHSLPNCLHQIAELFIDEKNYEKALQFIQAEKMFYEVALIELTALQRSTGTQEESTQGSPGWFSQEELSAQASQAQDLERLAQLCIMSKRVNKPLESFSKAMASGAASLKAFSSESRCVTADHMSHMNSPKPSKLTPIHY
ncbi:nutritionally-regulated adipose and cardiac enriched protein homolog isoform X1 [Tachysurus ichikawai]